MSDRMRIKKLSPKEIEVPNVRITSTWDPEMLEMFRKSIKDMGQVQPILVGEEEGKYILIDGLHRLEEAKLNDTKTVECAILPMSIKDVLLRNLVTNRLRGKTKASEMVLVISELREKHRMGIEKIVKETGMRREYIEQMLKISQVHRSVYEALDREDIGVGHAYQISLCPDLDAQERLLSQVLMYRIPVKDLKDIVVETNRILKERAETPVVEPPQGPAPIPTTKCNLCEEDKELRFVLGVNMCRECYGLCAQYIKKLRKEGPLPPTPAQDVAEKVVQGPPLSSVQE